MESALKEKWKCQKELEESAKKLEYFDSIIDPINALNFQQNARERVQPVFDKHNNLHSSDYSRDSSLDYPLHYSKRELKADKIFDIVYLKEATEKNIPLAHLESLLEDLRFHKEKTFTDEFCLEIKENLPKLLRVVSQHVFEFDKDAQESCLFMNITKSRKHRRRNMLAMQVLRENEFEIIDYDAA